MYVFCSGGPLADILILFLWIMVSMGGGDLNSGPPEDQTT